MRVHVIFVNFGYTAHISTICSIYYLAELLITLSSAQRNSTSTMPPKNAENAPWVEMHDRTFAKLPSTAESLEIHALGLDARSLALLEKRERLKVTSTYSFSYPAHLIKIS